MTATTTTVHADGAESDEDGMETDGRLGTQHVRTVREQLSAAIQIKYESFLCILMYEVLSFIKPFSSP
jgi:hypothetical protein